MAKMAVVLNFYNMADAR